MMHRFAFVLACLSLVGCAREAPTATTTRSTPATPAIRIAFPFSGLWSGTAATDPAPAGGPNAGLAYFVACSVSMHPLSDAERTYVGFVSCDGTQTLIRWLVDAHDDGAQLVITYRATLRGFADVAPVRPGSRVATMKFTREGGTVLEDVWPSGVWMSRQ